jgi:tetratricopeptide (TPR) repeat protein
MIPIAIGGHIAIGLLRLAQGRSSDAQADFTQARLLAANASPWRLADIDEGMGRVHLARGETDQAISMLQRALAIRRDAGVAFATARTLGLLASALDAADWAVEAAEARSEALTLLSELQDTAANLLRTGLGAAAR